MRSNFKDIDDSLHLASQMFIENCNEFIKLEVLNEQLFKEIERLLRKKYDIIEIDLYGNSMRIRANVDRMLDTQEILDIENLCKCKLERFEGNFYWFELNIDGNYNTIGNYGKRVSDFCEDYKRIKELFYE